MHEYYFCSTPYHILVAHFLAQSSSNKLQTLVLARGAALGRNSTFIKQDAWTNVIRLELPSSPKIPSRSAQKDILIQVRKVVDCNPGPISFYWGNDVDPYYQLVRWAVAPERTYLFEDGIGSYTSHNFTNSRVKASLRRVSYSLLLRGKYNNPHGLARSKADGYYALHSSAFPVVRERQKVKTFALEGTAYHSFLKERYNSAWEGLPSDAIWISQPLVEDGLLTIRQETTMLNKVAIFLHNEGYSSVSIKPHPSEDNPSVLRKADAFNGHGVRASILPAGLPPMEVMLLTGLSAKMVAGLTSTTLGNARALSPNVRSVSAFRQLGEIAQHTLQSYQTVLERLGVEFI